ncbi:hypothetical protein GCM10022200_00710 [Microbacterium awajiense]|uniref:Integral membrane protein n=1 Tax=Microbacterium awajiense TaxID=415214 RepID=A0ABP6ZZ12_9MICO
MANSSHSSDTVDLAARIRELEAENERLRAAADTGEPPTTEPPARERRPGLWRAILSAVCIVLAGILVPLSVVGAWARTELVSEEAFVQTFAPLAEDPDVQQLVIDQTTAAINASVDIEGITDDVFDGIAGLDLPPSAISALNLLRAPAVSGVQSLIDTSVTRIVESDAFAAVWQRALIASHRALVATATGNEGGAVTIDGSGAVGIELGPIVDELKDRLVEQGFGFASAIPAIDTTIIVAQSDALVIVGTVYGLAVTVGWWLPVVALALAIAGILIARRRSTASMGVGIALALGSGALAIGLTAAGAVLGLSAGNLGIPSRTLDTIFFTVVGAMRDTAVVLVFLGLVIAVAAWLAGRWSSAARVRGFAASLSAGARTGLRRRGLDTGAFGEWMYRQRVLVRIIILVIAILSLFLLRPLSFGDVILVVVLALLVWLVAVLVQRSPDDDPVVAAAPPEAEGVETEAAADETEAAHADATGRSVKA